MGTILMKPTSSQTSYEDRVRMVQLRKQGLSYPEIARRIGCSLWTVRRWVKAFERGGWEALAYKSCALKTPHPLRTPEAIRQRIREIKQAHPKWGARLIRRKLLLEGMEPVPSEVTIHKILRQEGFPKVREGRRERVSWASGGSEAEGVVQADFKPKGGTGDSML